MTINESSAGAGVTAELLVGSQGGATAAGSTTGHEAPDAAAPSPPTPAPLSQASEPLQQDLHLLYDSWHGFHGDATFLV